MQKLKMKIESKQNREKIINIFNNRESHKKFILKNNSMNNNEISQSSKNDAKFTLLNDNNKNYSIFNNNCNNTETNNNNPNIDKLKIHFFKELNRILEIETQSEGYKEIINKYFVDLIEFLKNTKNKSKTNKNNINNDDNKTLFYIDKVNINDFYAFVKEKYKNYKNTTKNYILSKLRKYIRLLNKDYSINYKKKLLFPRKQQRNIDLFKKN